jgi:hypothetical protein
MQKDNRSAAIGLAGQRIPRDGEGDTRTVPGHLESAGKLALAKAGGLDRGDDLAGDRLVHIDTRLQGFVFAG